jgi:Putative MetA-pathway of phenol degradation
MFWKSMPCAALAVLVLVPPAIAHHPSGVSSTGGGGPIATISASTLEAGHSAVGVFFEMVKIDPFSDAQLKTFAGQHIHAHSLDTILAPTLVYAYGLTNDLTVSARLPIVIRTDIREGHHSHGPAGNSVDERGDSAGIGDLTLLGQYRFFNNKATRTEAALLLGVKTPTGKTNVDDALGERFESEFQPGTGSWDGLVGLAFTQRSGAWSFDANVLYQLATTGAQDTDLGDRFLYNAAVTYRLSAGPAVPAGRMSLGALPEPMYHGGPKTARTRHQHAEPAPTPTHSLDLVLELNGEWHGAEVAAGVKDANSGGNVVYLSPGLRLAMDKWSGFVSVGIPVVNQVNGIQAEPDWRLLTGVAVAF